MDKDIAIAGRQEGVTAGARLDRLSISSFHRKMLGLIGAGMFLDGFDLYLAAGVLGGLVESGKSSRYGFERLAPGFNAVNGDLR